MLVINNLSKTFRGGIHAVQNLSFEVNDRRICGILGPNGAGKTTTIRMILNIIQPDAGSITLNNHPIAEESKNVLGYLPEERGLYKKSTIENTLLYFASLKQVPPAASRKMIEPWLERFNLGGMGKRKVEELSKGNQQKIQFIAAVIHNPDLLILDEPFSGLDPLNQILFKEVVMDLRKQGKAIIFCTHQLESAETICDDILLINKGQAVLNGSLESIKQKFTRNTLLVEFEGDGTFIHQLPIVERAIIEHGKAEIELHQGVSTNMLIQELIPNLQIVNLQKSAPSLLSIFTSVVGAENLSSDFLSQTQKELK
ncbi:MAG: ATP-binding cassette domain-containing protein [Ignavibacteriae bacterium]|nr:ATP-binding cassette domain-containing protein [Ignavibacteriota bacterium]